MASLSLAFDILARDRASKEFNKVGDAADRAGQKGAKFGAAVGAAVATATVAVGVFAKSAISSASAQEQALGGVQSVFGQAATAVEDYASRAATSIGLAKTEYASLAAVVGSQLQRMGQSQAESAQSTDRLITLGADLAATFGGSVSDAVAAVGSLLRGERDPIERYGVGINDAAIKAKLLQQGLGGLTGAALDQAKAQATLTLLTEQTRNAQGASTREAKTLEGQTIRLKAEYANFTAQIGTALLPVITGAIERFKSLAAFVKQNRDIVVPLIVVLGTFAAAVVTVNAAANAYKATQTALNIVLAANPIGLVVIGLAALTAALVLAYNKSETFRNVVNAVGNAMKTQVISTFNTAKGVVNTIGDAFGYVSGKVSALIGVLDRVADKIRSLPSLPNLGGIAGKIPGFADGGVVPGRIGAPTLAVVHGGELVLNPEQQRAMRGGGTTVNVYPQYANLDPQDLANVLRRAELLYG